MEKIRNYKYKMPQANNVDFLIKIINSFGQMRSYDEVTKTILPNIDLRQYYYYYDALCFLGLSEQYKYNNKRTYLASEDTLKLLKEFSAERILYEKIKANELYRKYLNNSKEDFSKMIEEKYNLKDRTLTRRINTINSWDKFVKKYEEDLNNERS